MMDGDWPGGPDEWSGQLGPDREGGHLHRERPSVLAPAVPFFLQSAAAMAGYVAGLSLAQAAGLALRISCATPVLGPAAGVAGVGFASAFAGACARAVREASEEGGGGGALGRPSARSLGGLGAIGPGLTTGPLSGWASARPAAPRQSFVELALVDAAVGIALFKLMGGRFRSVMPSDLSRPGAGARISAPAAGKEYASSSVRRDLAAALRRDGCHHCGSRSLPVVADHMPPNKQVAMSVRSGVVARLFQRVRPLRAISDALGVPIGPPRQRYYPQCLRCCQKQAGAVRAGKRTLVSHAPLLGGRARAWHWAGVLVGMRHYASGPAAATAPGAGVATLRRALVGGPGAAQLGRRMGGWGGGGMWGR